MQELTEDSVERDKSPDQHHGEHSAEGDARSDGYHDAGQEADMYLFHLNLIFPMNK